MCVSTPGLGYPLLLCLGKKSFVVILNYVQQSNPYGPEALFTRQRSRTRPLVGKGPGAPRVPEEADAQPEQPEAPDLAKGRNRHPASGWSGAATCLQAQNTYIKPLGLHIKVQLPLYSLR